VSDFAVWSNTTGLWKIKLSRKIDGQDQFIYRVLGGDYRDWPL
jgi:hypothetical protein